MKELNSAAETFPYSIFIVKCVPYLPHYTNKDLFVGPDGKEYHKDRFNRPDARRQTMMLWNRPGRLQDERMP
jgi:hypothetical protein